jgi:hypothetical protein
MLTTITPYWGRSQILRAWLAAVRGASFEGLRHIIYFIGEPVPDWVSREYEFDIRFHFEPLPNDTPGLLSIGHYHNRGANQAGTEWIMKLDGDALPNVRYFRTLVRLLQTAQPREWFNGGMVYIASTSSAHFLCAEQMPLREEAYKSIMSQLHYHCRSNRICPAATNFICRRKDYLRLGGCDERFRGYGWEDYQQVYMLERHYRGRDPLPGPVLEENVTQRCREEISRRRARDLLSRSPWLCLLHHHHPATTGGHYRTSTTISDNRKVLLDYVQKRRLNEDK